VNIRTGLLVAAVAILSFLVGRNYHRNSPSQDSHAGRRILYYQDPMHPDYKSDKPGIAPDCGMQLEAVYADVAATEAGGTLPPGTVVISEDKRQLMGIRVEAAEKSASRSTVRVLGRVAVDEIRVYRINAATDGWIRETFPNTMGAMAKKDEPLVTYYAPEFLGAQQAYLYALDALDRFEAAGKETPEQIKLTQATVQQAVDGLRNLGMNDIQIQEMKRTRKLTQNIAVYAPAAGLIVARNVSPSQRFERGTELYRIADLSRVWIVADLFENEEQYFRPGLIAHVRLSYQKQVFTARVSGVLPQFDPATRTMKVRLEAENPGYVLRPDMFVDIDFPLALSTTVTVPTDAVLDSGLRKTAFVECKSGVFEPRTVETGWRFGDRVEVLRGIAPGERVVVSGNFFVDSESRLKTAAAGIHDGPVKDPVYSVVTDKSNYPERYRNKNPDTVRLGPTSAPARGTHD
jgi:membrane fusion protein, copper/silver efflux system